MNKKTKDALKSKIISNTTVDSETNCWEWQVAKDQYGYGAIRFNNEYHVAHRLAYRLFVGPIPKNKVVMHECDNPSCVNPEHLKVGTQAENLRDMALRGRSTKNWKRYTNGRFNVVIKPNARVPQGFYRGQTNTVGV